MSKLQSSISHILPALHTGGNRRGCQDQLFLFIDGGSTPYLTAHLFVFPSLYEGFGLPPLEVMACGTPVVTSNSSSLPEVVGDAALTVDPYDVGAIAAAMAAILADPALAADLRQRGLARAGRFSWERMAQETIKVYQHVLKA
jgi:glycosyltransferase involved in cell wall biosynthesis